MSQRPHREATLVCLPLHPAVAYLVLVRSMRTIVIAIFAAIVHAALADETYPVVLYETNDAQGHRLQYCSDTETL